MTDRVPIDPGCEISLDNVLTDIRFRGESGLVLSDYRFTAGNTIVELEFVPCSSVTKSKAKELKA